MLPILSVGAAVHLDGPITGTCESRAHRFWNRLSGAWAPIGYRGLRGAFAFAQRRAEGPMPSMSRLNTEVQILLSDTNYMATLPEALHMKGLSDFSRLAFRIAEKSSGPQNMSPDLETANSYASQRGLSESGELFDFGFVLGARLVKGIVWGRDQGFYGNTQHDKELKVPAEEFAAHPATAWIQRIFYMGIGYQPEDPALPSHWRKHLAFAQELSDYLVNLPSNFYLYDRGSRRSDADERFRQLLTFFVGLRKKYHFEEQHRSPLPFNFETYTGPFLWD